MLNKVELIGHLGANPEMTYTPNGTAVATMRIATNMPTGKRDNDGKPVMHTEWHRVVVWDKQAEACNKYLAKGGLVYIEGRLQTRKWTDKNGQDRWTTEIVAQNVRFLSRSQRTAEEEADVEQEIEEEQHTKPSRPAAQSANAARNVQNEVLRTRML